MAEQVLSGHTDGIRCVCSLPDGRVVSASADTTLRVWDVATGECVKVLEGHAAMVFAVCCLPDGRVVSGGGGVVRGGGNNELRVWNVATGECIKVLEGHTHIVWGVCPLPDGRVVSGSNDKTLRVWDVATGECIRVLEGHTEGVFNVCSLPDGNVVSVSTDKTVRVWNVTTGECIRVLEGHTKAVRSVCFIPDGLVVSGSDDTTLRVWNIASGECIRVLEGHTSIVYCLCSLPDGNVVSGSIDKTLRVWNVATGECVNVLESNPGKVFAVCCLPDGRVVSGFDNATLKVWTLGSMAPQLWAGWTAGDVAKFDTVFGDDEAADFSCCPICLKYIERSAACNYIREHNCSALGGFYHKRLYNLYKNAQGEICWCTVCDRIASDHQHYKLGPAQGGKLELYPEAEHTYEHFAKDCRPSGGGGPMEKLARFRRLREYALELQADVGKKTHQAAMEELVEEMWNAPLVRKRGLPEMLAAKHFNIPSSAFPANVATANFSTLANVVRPAANREAFKPTLVDGENSTYTEDDPTKQVIRFHHRLGNGTPFIHGDELLISVAGLVEWCTNALQSTHAEKFGYCWAYPRCMAKLYPEEVKEFLPAELYNKYRQNFNWKFRAGAAGGRRLRLLTRRRRSATRRRRSKQSRRGNQ